jgi:hypothetical protein
VTSGPVDPSLVVARQRILVAAGVALLVAGLVLVAVVLPAEYGVDPLGTGARFGLLPLGELGKQVAALDQSATSRQPNEAPIVAAEERPFHGETVTFTLAPRGSIEYKYRLEKGKALLYSWSATAPVDYELHAEPDGAPKGYAQSYEKESARDRAAGTLTAPFTGIHGWFWENRTDREATVTLTTAGFYSLSHEFRKDQPVKNKEFR